MCLVKHWGDKKKDKKNIVLFIMRKLLELGCSIEAQSVKINEGIK